MARRGSPRAWQRSDRLSEQIRGIVATELGRLGDERLELVTVTAVEVDGSLERARVFYSAFSAEADGRSAEDVAEGLEELRWPIQQVVNREVRARKTPQISFHPDDVLLGALRIDELLADIAETDGEADDAAETDGEADDAAGTDGAADADSAPSGEQ